MVQTRLSTSIHHCVFINVISYGSIFCRKKNPFFALFLLNYTQCHTRSHAWAPPQMGSKWSYFVWAERGWRREHTNKYTHLGHQPHLFGRRFVVSLVLFTRPQNMMQKQKETVRQKSHNSSPLIRILSILRTPSIITTSYINTSTRQLNHSVLRFEACDRPLLFAVCPDTDITQKPVANWIHVFNFFIFNYIVLEEFFESIKNERVFKINKIYWIVWNFRIHNQTNRVHSNTKLNFNPKLHYINTTTRTHIHIYTLKFQFMTKHSNPFLRFAFVPAQFVWHLYNIDLSDLCHNPSDLCLWLLIGRA